MYNFTFTEGSLPWRLLEIEKDLSQKLKQITFSDPISCIYNPLEYALGVHSQYVAKYCTSSKKILFLGMNPGPFGMSQTGVPFGEVNLVKDWLEIYGPVGKPEVELPERPVMGFECHRSEISGQRFWSLWKDLCNTPEVFFRHSFVHNYCPLQLMTSTGKNISAAELKASQRELLFSLCDEALVDVVRLLGVETVIGVGNFAKEKAKSALRTAGLCHIQVVSILHPSPRNPGSNKNWNEKVIAQLEEVDVMKYFASD